MRTMKTVKVFLFACLVGIIAGCKLAVIVVEGGEVQSDASGTCTAGTVCIIEVNDMNFSDAFTAVPDSGWYFEKWNAAWGFFCGDSLNPTCTLSLAPGAGNTDIEALVASSATFYIMPVFRMVNPITDTVSVDGKEWAQVDLFTNLSWEDITAVCSENTGICTGELNSYDVTGWIWASVEDLNALFNHYIGTDELGPGPDSIGNNDCEVEWITSFYSSGWRTTLKIGSDTSYRRIEGWIKDTYDATRGRVALLSDASPELCGAFSDSATTGYQLLQSQIGSHLGAWLYRIP